MVTIDPNAEILAGLGLGNKNEVSTSTVQRSKHLQYWKLCSGCQVHTEQLGWVILGPAMSPYTATEYYEFQRGKHATPLEKYGSYMAGKSSASKYDVVEPERRFEPLIEQNGLTEIPFDQMVAYNWHRIPVIVKYIPALADIIDYKCEYGCLNKLFNSETGLQLHIRVWHNDVAQPQAVGREISKAIEAVKDSSGMSPDTIAAIVVAVREALRAESK